MSDPHEAAFNGSVEQVVAFFRRVRLTSTCSTGWGVLVNAGVPEPMLDLLDHLMAHPAFTWLLTTVTSVFDRGERER